MDYDHNTECIWKITVPANAALRLHFEEFDTECLHDYLEIHHVNTEAGTATRCVFITSLVFIFTNGNLSTAQNAFVGTLQVVAPSLVTFWWTRSF
jgi:hypothetical protein